MGAGVIGSLWGQRRTAAGVVLLHGIAPIPANARIGLPVQVHVAEDDPFAPLQAVARWQADALRAGLAAEACRVLQRSLSAAGPAGSWPG